MNKNKVNPIDALYDENNEDNIFLYNENDEPIEFAQIAVIPIEENVYVILKPIEPVEGIADDEALVFEIIDDEEIHIVKDEKIATKVFDIYYEMLNKEGN